ncbi:MAG TPA: ABC transporter permease [Spirochaetia bacterium]|nr:ABC transporter permease [Spirochaetia bacterium]
MSAPLRQLLLVARYTILRLLREPASTIVTVGLPLVLIPVMGTVFTKIGSWDSYMDGAVNPTAFFAIGIVVMFQLFGGRFSMEATRASLLSERRWRINAAPCEPGIYAIGILTAGTLVDLLQGLLLVAFTYLALDVHWGNLGVVVLVLLGTSLLAQLVHVAIVLLVRSYGAAVTIAWMFAWGSAALGGLIIPLPSDVPVWRFMLSYGTPYSLAQTAVVTSVRGGAAPEVALCVGLLLALCAVFASLVFVLGRRRLA